MKRTALATATFAAAIAAVPATAAAPTLSPHIYGVKITGASVPTLNATWRIAINKPAFQITRNGALAVGGTVTIVGARVTFHDVAGPLACKGRQVNGTYGWKITGAKLKLTRFTDACVGRRTVLSFPFTRIA